MSVIDRLRSGFEISVVVLFVAAFVGAAFIAAPAVAQKASTASIRPAPGHKVHVVLMELKKAEFIYDPATLSVNVGDVIEWQNKDMYRHTVTAINRKSFDSGMIMPGKSWRYKVTKPGTFHYFCTLHPNMKGTFTVR